ncbi:adventurous gliding motility lipoprotein CglD [Myxococcus sp. CA051A]|uniref:adventurous gliding motility lipoprotein CglC n=1 Tax=unclassified Myxococcus TaxID=2648731 RepID=UPI00157A6413|nr:MULTISPECIES: adventurous gliding motility lipoprotein CglC [unclassified Myxococcus]NTX04196.1 adventurous gliding motility lipoprotein CglD [Myxococcus sp. CA040A]NTX13184.1 adventurous gliding motility lipoprotein CglD [Myxococcus sp. CA056]NTX36365.1 adventurous gliding motility lipoprotein CglD [Myxococcus sp. CA033]NTX56599.1 adventurous gliding motility lipoprotein CglD [Myxococcus sp. CA039A]NTX64673.1 adventurous gliding motility lipoprotein CglD [Myxococcus sp. CA051A]
MKMSVRAAFLVSTALLLGGCKVSSEIGKPCTLVRKALPEENSPTKTMPVLESEVADRQDFISFGSVECEDLICVRDQDYPRARTEDGAVNPTAPAMGYCSKPCIDGASSDACEVKDTSDVNPDLPGRMTCRSLLLDEDTLDALRSADEDFYRRTFGENNSPFFCAGNISAQGG